MSPEGDYITIVEGRSWLSEYYAIPPVAVRVHTRELLSEGAHALLTSRAAQSTHATHGHSRTLAQERDKKGHKRQKTHDTNSTHLAINDISATVRIRQEASGAKQNPLVRRQEQALQGVVVRIPGVPRHRQKKKRRRRSRKRGRVGVGWG